MWKLGWLTSKPCLEGILPVSLGQNLLLLLIKTNLFVVLKLVVFLVEVLSNEKYNDILIMAVSASFWGGHLTNACTCNALPHMQSVEIIFIKTYLCLVFLNCLPCFLLGQFKHILTIQNLSVNS